MNYTGIFENILDLGAAMIKCGGEVRRVEIAVDILAKSYGFSKCNFFVIPAYINGTVTSPDGETITQIREIGISSADYGRLDKLNALSRRIAADKPDAAVFSDELAEIMREEKQSTLFKYIASAIGVAGFSVFFGCDLMDVLVAILVSFAGTFLLDHFSGREQNPLMKNFVISLVLEFLILLMVHLGIGHHSGYITIGVVMQLISGLATTNGIHDLVHLDTVSGISNIILSATGAIGIALGMAVPIYFLHSWGSGELFPAAISPAVTLIGTAGACFGFSLCYGIRGKKLITCTVGGVLTAGVYVIASGIISNSFIANLVASIFTGIYAQVMVRIEKAPSTLFNTFGVFPLIPGSSLYYLMYGLIIQDSGMATSSTIGLLNASFGIVLGLMVVESVVKYMAGSRKILENKIKQRRAGQK